MRRTRHPVWLNGFLVVVVFTTASRCATNPVTGEREFVLMSEDQEIALGQQADGEIRKEMGVYEDTRLQEYVEQIGLTLAKRSHRPDLPWHFTVIDSPVVNAFALPGGYVYLTRGILAYLGDEAELAGVLGHEIGHVTARHSVQAYTRAAGAQIGLTLGAIFAPGTRPFLDVAQSGLGLLFLKYGRDDELQADRLGAEYAATNGWDPRGVPDMLTTLARLDEAAERERAIPNWLSTHPEPGARVEEIAGTVAKLRQTPTEFQVDRAAYLGRIDGIVYGDSPEQGIVRGSEFLHPDLRFALQFPEGWQVQNTAQQVVAKAPGAEHYMLLQLAEARRRGDLERFAVDSMRSAGYRIQSGGTTTIGGLEAFLGTYLGNMQGIGRVQARVAHIPYRNEIYVFGGLAPTDAFARVDEEFARSIRSFRPLSAGEAEQIRPNRIAIYTVRQGDTWQAIAQRASQGIVEPRTLAVMNGYPVNEQPREGDRIKIVVAG